MTQPAGQGRFAGSLWISRVFTCAVLGLVSGCAQHPVFVLPREIPARSAFVTHLRPAGTHPAQNADLALQRVGSMSDVAAEPGDIAMAPSQADAPDDARQVSLGDGAPIARLEPPVAEPPALEESAPSARPASEGPSLEAAASALDRTPAFRDEIRLGQARERFRPGTGGPSPEESEDTDLSRPRAEREGEGGGPTRVAEEEDEELQYPKSNLLIKALGLEDSPYKIFGWLEGSFTGAPGQPAGQEIFGVNPNNIANRFLFNQLYLVMEKRLDEEKDYDWGFRFDNLLGTDWSQFHDVGLFDNAFRFGKFGYDPVQMFAQIHLPFFSTEGIDIKGGRFYALPGYEDGPAPGRPLLSTGYMFSFAHPFTHFGMMSTWYVNDQINLYNGVVNGWDRWIDRRFKWGYAGGASWDSKDGRTNLTVTLNWGPNQYPNFFPANFQDAPNGVTQPPFLAGRRNPQFGKNDTILFTEVLSHEWTDAFTTIFEADQGFTNNVPGAGPDGTYANAEWYGLGSWLLYEFTDHLTGVYRAEVFRDQNGVRTGFDDTFYEMTLGLIYRPWPWLWFRPETRFDWATGPDKPYNNETAKHQFTLGFDAIFLF